jgi:hypothetical protein
VLAYKLNQAGDEWIVLQQITLHSLAAGTHSSKKEARWPA